MRTKGPAGANRRDFIKLLLILAADRGQMITIVSAYSPTEAASDEEAGDFYLQVAALADKANDKRDLLIVAGSVVFMYAFATMVAWLSGDFAPRDPARARAGAPTPERAGADAGDAARLERLLKMNTRDPEIKAQQGAARAQLRRQRKQDTGDYGDGAADNAGADKADVGPKGRRYENDEDEPEAGPGGRAYADVGSDGSGRGRDTE
ncbi:hypothetical protein FOA52_012534 [Chlamydomonas sp. UWO 241]|nr:hypothetical protein FOA52_012534 [Chlamydomonas sp. UWO 241]